MELASLVDQPNKLPTIPKVLQKLIESFSDEDVSVNEIARQLAADPALSAKLLRLANSAYFHVSRTVGTVDDAVRMLGFVMVRNLVLGNGMVEAFPRIPGIDLQQFWRYNLYTASASRWLAVMADENGDTAFTLGIMHAIGQLQMHMGMRETMLALDNKMHILDAGRAELEKNALGFHYGEVSAALAKIWNFPPYLIDALRDVPAPLAAGKFSRPAALVHLGAWRARAEVLAMDEGAIAASYPDDVGKRLDLDRGWLPAKPWVATPASAPPKHVMPPLKVLAEGLDAMLN
ncbi:HDOD domain-containing protein [Oxalobacteraceae bacterium CAVE-383]|nr:HDOD domain-containing protein [Oxalobacteraceae bacterium CAVE-383]